MCIYICKLSELLVIYTNHLRNQGKLVKYSEKYGLPVKQNSKNST